MPCSRSCLTQTLPPTPSCAAASWRRSAPRSTSGSVTATLPAEKRSRSRWRTRWFGRTRARRCRPSWPRRTKDALVDGELYRFHEAGSHTYASFVDPLEVERPTFRQVGIRNGPTVVPLDLAAGLLHGTTPALAWRFARGKAKDAARDLFDDLVASHRVPPCRTTLENKGNAIGAALHRRQGVVRAAARRGEALRDGARTRSKPSPPSRNGRSGSTTTTRWGTPGPPPRRWRVTRARPRRAARRRYATTMTPSTPSQRCANARSPAGISPAIASRWTMSSRSSRTKAPPCATRQPGPEDRERRGGA